MSQQTQVTSVEARQHVLKNLGQKQAEVYDAIKRWQPVCNLAIASYLGKPINTITPRVNELCKLGVVKPSGVTISSSGRRAITWETVMPQELF